MSDDQPRARVIIVDDEPESLKAMQTAVTLSGHRCATASTTEEALAQCMRTRFECMLLDEVLGDDSGLGLAATLRRLGPLRPVRILMVSGLPDELFQEAIKDGVIDGFMQKPVTLSELLAGVESSLACDPPTR